MAKAEYRFMGRLSRRIRGLRSCSCLTGLRHLPPFPSVIFPSGCDMALPQRAFQGILPPITVATRVPPARFRGTLGFFLPGWRFTSVTTVAGGHMTFWIIITVLALAVSGLMGLALLRGRVGDEPPAAFDLRVYRAQLKEVDRDLARGV
ncbi:MAG: c-type cytochrome biogenesis protein CcmI, partial [Pseudomonadota bacterium]|nr:c-type cytochrome biogenesis protein CcmI [Pseudomonadota bacterium]